MKPQWGFLYFRNRKSSNILQISNASICTHADLRKYEVKMDCLPFYKQKSCNILFLLHLLWTISSNTLQIEYQMQAFTHTDLRKYEATMGFLIVFYTQKIQPTSLLFVCKRD